jgi:hypothetical protein
VHILEKAFRKAKRGFRQVRRLSTIPPGVLDQLTECEIEIYQYIYNVHNELFGSDQAPPGSEPGSYNGEESGRLPTTQTEPQGGSSGGSYVNLHLDKAVNRINKAFKLLLKVSPDEGVKDQHFALREDMKEFFYYPEINSNEATPWLYLSPLFAGPYNPDGEPAPGFGIEDKPKALRRLDKALRKLNKGFTVLKAERPDVYVRLLMDDRLQILTTYITDLQGAIADEHA